MRAAAVAAAVAVDLQVEVDALVFVVCNVATEMHDISQQHARASDDGVCSEARPGPADALGENEGIVACSCRCKVPPVAIVANPTIYVSGRL